MDVWVGVGDLFGGVDEIDIIVVVFFDFCCYGKDVGVKDDVFGCYVVDFGQDVIGVLVNFDFVVFVVGLIGFVKGYDYNCCFIGVVQVGVMDELFFVFFE